MQDRVVEKQSHSLFRRYLHGGLRCVLEVMLAKRGRAALEIVVQIDQEREKAPLAVRSFVKSIAMPIEFLTHVVAVQSQSLV